MDLSINDLGLTRLDYLDLYLKAYINSKLIRVLTVKNKTTRVLKENE